MSAPSVCSTCCFIVPPHILEHIAINADEVELRKRAIMNLQAQSRVRGMREGLAQFAFAGLGTGTMRRTIYDAKHKTTLAGTLVRSEGQTGGKDVGVNEAYAYSGETYDFYHQVFKR